MPRNGIHHCRPVEFTIYAVQLGHLLGQLLAVALRETAHCIDSANFFIIFELNGTKKRIDRLLLRISDKAAGIDYQYTAVMRQLLYKTHLKSGIREAACQTLAVYKILGTPETKD